DLGGQSLAVVAGDLRLAAHRIADALYEKLTGEKGVFSTRIAYVTRSAGRRFALRITDADGEGGQVALQSPEPIISPAWSPNVKRLTTSIGIDTEPVYTRDGRMIYFVSDRGGSPQIYRLPVSGGNAERVSFSGAYNISPDLSPDGQTLAFITRNGGGAFKLMT